MVSSGLDILSAMVAPPGIGFPTPHALVFSVFLSIIQYLANLSKWFSSSSKKVVYKP